MADATAESESVLSLLERIDAYQPEIAKFAVRTPLEIFPAAGELIGAQVLLKCEHLQHTGSFKVRGALAKLMAIGPDAREAGVVAASSGNHGLGVAYALGVLGGSGVVFVPERASAVKVGAIERLGVEVRHVGRSMEATEARARDFALAGNGVYISPYNDIDVVAGQGSVGVEVADQLSADFVDVVIVAVGGGGLIAGVAAAIKARSPRTVVVGACPANDAAMAASVRAGEIVDIAARPTLSDGTAGGIEAGSVTFTLCAELVDDWVLVSESEISRAIGFMIDTRHQLIEGAAAVALAAALNSGDRWYGKRIVVVSCGANIAASALREALAGV